MTRAIDDGVRICRKCQKEIHLKKGFWISEDGYVSCGIHQVYHEPYPIDEVAK